MTWNYRVIRHPSRIRDRTSGKIIDTTHLAIHEVYYDDHAKITSWSATPIELKGYTDLADLETDLGYFADATSRAVLTECHQCVELHETERCPDGNLRWWERPAADDADPAAVE